MHSKADVTRASLSSRNVSRNEIAVCNCARNNLTQQKQTCIPNKIYHSTKWTDTRRRVSFDAPIVKHQAGGNIAIRQWRHGSRAPAWRSVGRRGGPRPSVTAFVHRER